MKVWVTRDKNDGDGKHDSCVVVTESKPVLRRDKETYRHHYGKDDDFDMYISAVNCKKKYKFTPRKGSCKQYELTLKEIK